METIIHHREQLKVDLQALEKMAGQLQEEIKSLEKTSAQIQSVCDAIRKEAGIAAQRQVGTAKTAEGFLDFWREYPNKKAKVTAMKAWEKLKPDKNLQETILRDIEAKKRSAEWLEDGGKYIPHPATYLNQKRWEDETKPAPARDHGYNEHEAKGLDHLLVDLDK